MLVEVMRLDMSLAAVKLTVKDGAGPLSERLAWASAELERLAVEYREAAERIREHELRQLETGKPT